MRKLVFLESFFFFFAISHNAQNITECATQKLISNLLPRYGFIKYYIKTIIHSFRVSHCILLYRQISPTRHLNLFNLYAEDYFLPQKSKDTRYRYECSDKRTKFRNHHSVNKTYLLSLRRTHYRVLEQRYSSKLTGGGGEIYSPKKFSTLRKIRRGMLCECRRMRLQKVVRKLSYFI